MRHSEKEGKKERKKEGERDRPVNDVVFVKVLQSEDDASGVETGSGFGEHVGMDVHHEIAARGVFHHEAHMILR